MSYQKLVFHSGMLLNPFDFHANTLPWAILGQWTGSYSNYIAKVRANINGTAEQLAFLITGDKNDWKLLGLSNEIKKGQIVNVAPLLVRIENILRENTIKAIDAVGINFGAVSAVVDISPDAAKQLDKYFDGKKEDDEYRDCDGAALLIYAKAVRDLLSAEIYNEFNYTIVPTLKLTGKRINDMQNGDRAYFLNYDDYIAKFPSGGYIAENVIKYAEDLYWGHPKGKLSENKWYEVLKKEYNAPNDEPVGKQRTERVPGFNGKIETYNVPKIAKDAFIYRRIKRIVR